VGVEIESDLVERFRRLIETERQQSEVEEGPRGDDQRVRAVQGDLCGMLEDLVALAEGKEVVGGTTSDSDLPMPTIICTYLLHEAIRLVQPNLERLLRSIPNLRILCNTWGLEESDTLRAIDCFEATEGIEGSATLTLFTRESLVDS